jgi:O-antigen/teichoic acid export membrane protein
VNSLPQKETVNILAGSKQEDDGHLVKVARGGGITLVGKIFTNATRVIIAFIVPRLLGAEQYGMYQLALSAITLLAGITILGLDGALVRFLAIYVARGDKERTWGTILFGVGLPLVLGSIASVGLFVFSYQVADRIFHDVSMAPLLQVASVIIPLSVSGDSLIGALRGFKNMKYPVIAKFIAQPLVKVVLIGVVALMDLRAVYAVVIFGIGELITALMLIYYLNRLFPLNIPVTTARVDFTAIIKFTVPAFMAELLDVFRTNIQTLLMGSLGSFAGVGIFTVANQLNTLGHDFYSSINTAAKPYIAELHDRKEMQQLQKIYQVANKWSFIVNMPFFLTMILFPVQILSIFGKSFQNGVPALMIMACASLVDVATGMGGAVINMTGYTRLKLLNNIVGLSISLVLNVLLIPPYGVVGAAISALVVFTALNTIRIVQVYYIMGLLPYNVTFIKPVLASLIAYAVTYILSMIYPIDAYLIHLFVYVSVLFVVFALSLLLLGLDPDDQQMARRIAGKRFGFLFRNKV